MSWSSRPLEVETLLRTAVPEATLPRAPQVALSAPLAPSTTTGTPRRRALLVLKARTRRWGRPNACTIRIHARLMLWPASQTSSAKASSYLVMRVLALQTRCAQHWCSVTWIKTVAMRQVAMAVRLRASLIRSTPSFRQIHQTFLEWLSICAVSRPSSTHPHATMMSSRISRKQRARYVALAGAVWS